MLPVILLVAFIGGSLTSLILVEMLFNDGWLLAFKALAALELLLVPWLLFRYRKPLLDFSYYQPGTTLFLLASGCGGFLLMGAPYIFLANALSTSGELVLFAGPVANKWISHGKSDSYVVQVADVRTREHVNILASRQEFESVAVGAPFSRCMSVGGLKLPYVWRYGVKPSCPGQ